MIEQQNPDNQGIGSPQSILGVDAGSTRIKGALWTGSSWILSAISSGISYEEEVRSLIDIITSHAGISPDYIITTGYGRKMVPKVTQVVNEIGCHGKGAGYLVPGCRTVIDIGGQDAKVICVSPQGKVTDFAMNDKCAAGTGRFLSILANSLSVSLDDLGIIGRDAEPLRLSSMCTVFAESEVIGLLSRGYAVPEIVAGINDAIARRTVSLASRLSITPKVVFTGGVSANSDIISRLSRMIALEITVPDHAEYSGAIGAVLSAGNPEPWSLVPVQVLRTE